MRDLCLLAAALSVGLSAAFAQRSQDVVALLSQGLDAALRHDYATARSSFEAASSTAPDDPAGPVLLAGLLHQSAEDLSTPFDRRAFDSLLTQAEVRTTSVQASGLSDRHMWRSTARGMLSVVESQSGQWMAAIRDALASSTEARASLESEAGLADAGLPMGNYLYWRSRKTEALQWLPFIPDDRDEGIRLLEWCAREGRYHRWAAVSSLIWVLHDAGNLGRAEQWARSGLESYPENRTFLAGLAKVLETRGAHREASELWARIAASLHTAPGVGRYAIFSAAVNQARCAIAAGDLPTAAGLLGRVTAPLPLEVPEGLRSRLEVKRSEWSSLRTVVSADPSTTARTPGDR